MLNNDQLQNIMLFPFRDKDAQKNFLIASLVALVGLAIPILPWLALYGYAVRIMRQIINEKQEPSMPAWTDWKQLLGDGLRLIVIRMVVLIPILVVLGIGMLLSFAPVLLMSVLPENDTSSMILSMVFVLANMLWVVIFMVVALLAVPLSVILGAVEGHIVSQESLNAALRVKEWWPIFRKNMAGFIIGYLIISAIGVIVSLTMQIMIYTIILLCLLPFLLAPYSAYATITMYAMFAKAYAQGRDALQTTTPDL